MADAPAEFVVLVFNSGSSSLKVALCTFHIGAPKKLVQGEAEEIGSENSPVWLRGAPEVALKETRRFSDSGEAAEFLTRAIFKGSMPRPQAIGHRIVHGGPKLREHQRITPEVLDQLQQAIKFAPLHVPSALRVIEEATKAFPNIPQIACFDTAFHRSLPVHAARLPFGREFWDQGLKRYGFHGLVCESVVRSLGKDLASRAVVAHLGNGCSLTALQNGRSVETTMGLTPTGGVMMGTRPGDLDPGVLLNLLADGYDKERLDSLLNHRAGLLGVSGTSSDMRRLLELREKDGNAKLAIQMFCYSIRKAIGSLSAVLGGLEMLIFSGGIGEHAAAVRKEICSGLEYLGIELNETANQSGAPQIRLAGTRCDVRVVEADEDLEIALHCQRLATIEQ
jgi:acetate kinase